MRKTPDASPVKVKMCRVIVSVLLACVAFPGSLSQPETLSAIQLSSLVMIPEVTYLTDPTSTH